MIDTMGIHYDTASRRLTKNFGKCNRKNLFASKQITKNVSRPNAGELIRISHHNQFGPRTNCTQQSLEEFYVHH